MERRAYQITLKNWLTRATRDFVLGESRTEANEQLKFLRKKHSKLMWIKVTPIHC